MRQIRNELGKTKAMCLVVEGKEIPRWCEHYPGTQDNDGWTVAMYLIFNEKEIPAQWEHDPSL